MVANLATPHVSRALSRAVARQGAARRDVDPAIALRFYGDMRFGILIAVVVASACGGRNVTPSSSRCNLLNSPSQLDGCVGKTVTIRGKVVGQPRPSIIGVYVDAAANLFEQWGHASGTLEKSGVAYSLKHGGALAKAHATTTPGK